MTLPCRYPHCECFRSIEKRAATCGFISIEFAEANYRKSQEIDAAMALVRAELVRAMDKHPNGMHSMHEAYGVIAEEFNKEFLDAMHANDGPQAMSELVQVAAMAIRALVEVRV